MTGLDRNWLSQIGGLKREAHEARPDQAKPDDVGGEEICPAVGSKSRLVICVCQHLSVESVGLLHPTLDLTC